MAGLYTMAWARRWIGHLAAGVGTFLAFMPGIVVWSNTVMLNIPAAALGVASLYLVALVPFLAALLLAPVHTSRHVPTVAFLSRLTTWTYYWRRLPDVIGRPALIVGPAGCAAGCVIARWRTEAVYIGTWIIVLITSLSLLPARDLRYILLAAPAFVIAAAIGVASRSELELVRSFPITGAGVRRVDRYRIVNGVDPVATVDLGFPSLGNREFLHIVPITR